jgi:hypothetical protein
MIASPSDLRNAIEERYFGKRPPSQPPAARGAQYGDDAGRSSKPGRLPPKAKPEDERQAKRPPPPPKPVARVEGAVPVEQYAAPSNPPAGEGGSGRTLTLLDGTRIQLPSNRKAPAAQAATKVRHVVKAVSAASAELGAPSSLRWHDIVQAVIDAAAVRGVSLTRREIGEAWKEARTREAQAQSEAESRNAAHEQPKSGPANAGEAKPAEKAERPRNA